MQRGICTTAQSAQGTARLLVSATCSMWDGQQENEARELTMTHCKKSLGSCQEAQGVGICLVGVERLLKDF